MPDNVTLPGTGSVVEAVEVGGAMRQVVQVANLPDTQPVSAAVRARGIFLTKVDVEDCGGQMTTCPAQAAGSKAA